jgi:DNA-binding transcriptional regulator YhcF (GntR family)
MSGYARLHRSLLGHPAFRNDAEAMAFAWMILRASWKPARVRYKGKPIMLARGQLATSVRDLADAMDRDKAWIERLFKRLKAETMIETHTETGVTVVTICNYAQYQSDGEAGETVRETLRETEARQTQDTEQEDKEFKKEEPKGSDTETRARAVFVCPPGVDRQHWADFLANRKRKHLTNTVTAYEGQMRALADLSDDEWPPGRLVEHAAAKGWGSINNPRDAGVIRHGPRNGTSQTGRGKVIDAAFGFIEDGGHHRSATR